MNNMENSLSIVCAAEMQPKSTKQHCKYIIPTVWSAIQFLACHLDAALVQRVSV
jgi:hypothetical protein